MSSHASLDVSILVCNGLLSPQMAKELLGLCLEELNGRIVGTKVYLDDKYIGTLSVSKRIVLTADSTVFQTTKNDREKLRDLLTKKAEVMQQNYIDNLVDEKEQLRRSDMVLKELSARIKEVDDKIKQSEKARQRQTLDECQAFEQELCEEAENQGFDVVKEQTENGIQLQFIKREY